jgi:Ni/Co efflux regulator RcnB
MTMKRTAIVCTLVAAALGAGSFAQAQVPQPQPQWGNADPNSPNFQPSVVFGAANGGPSTYYDGGNRYGGTYPEEYPPQYGHYRHHRQRWAAGTYAPPEYYRDHRYWVRDWRARRLAPPPDGYQWVQTDTGDVLLIALATGIIASVIANR